MTEPRRDDHLEYHKPVGPSKAKVGSCMGLSVVFAALVGIVFALMVAVGPAWMKFTLVGTLVAAIVIAVMMRRRDAMYPAIAIATVAGAMFLLMLGLCTVGG